MYCAEVTEDKEIVYLCYFVCAVTLFSSNRTHFQKKKIVFRWILHCMRMCVSVCLCVCVKKVYININIPTAVNNIREKLYSITDEYNLRE